jgi:acetolactate synthase-1/2/3 large subunit
MHHRLPVKVFILNNGGYLTIKQTQELGFDGRIMGVDEDSGLSFPDFMKLAEAHNFKGVRLTSHQGLKDAIQEIMDHGGPVLCEIMMDPNQMQAPKSINRRNADGTMKQTPIEDSFPFLNPDEVAANLDIINKI